MVFIIHSIINKMKYSLILFDRSITPILIKILFIPHQSNKKKVNKTLHTSVLIYEID